MAMYRQYEDPYTLEDQLAEAKADYENALMNGEDEDTLMSLVETIHELKERVNFAWQDDEYDE